MSTIRFWQKVFSMRLDTVITKLIGAQQTGFVTDHFRGTLRPGGILLAIDFMAAFDTINMYYI